MNILFLCRRFHPDIGGVEKHVREISKRLIEKGHTVTVVSEGNQSTAKNLLGIQSIKIDVGKDRKIKKFLIWQWFWKNKKLIQDATVIHVHDVFYWYLPFRFLYPRKPIFTTFHGYESYPIKKKAIILRKISEILSTGNICIGDFIKKWYKTTPTFVSYGAVNTQKIRETNYNNKNSALFIGRLDEQTGILTYVRAFEYLKKKLPNFELIAVGDGKYKKQIEKTVKALGFQRDPEKYFKQYHFAFVSRYLSILEAFAAKKLVIATYDNPVKKDYLTMAPFASFIVIEKDPKRIADQVEHFIDNPKLEKQMVEKAYQWVKKQTWEEMVNLYLNLWQKQK